MTKGRHLPRTEDSLGSIYAGRFRVVNAIGQGRHGRVYLAEDLEGQRTVAIKVLDHIGRASAEQVDRVETLVERLARLSHAGVVATESLHVLADGRLLLAMPYLNAGSLAPERPLLPNLVSILRWMADVLEILGHVHARGRAHGDLKPSNVLLHLGNDGALRVRVADFGLAWALGYPHLVPMPGFEHRLGGPSYAPSREADLYASAAILYELIAGQPALDWSMPVGWQLAHTVAPIPHLVPRADLDVPEDLIGDIMQALAPLPSERPEQAAELRRVLVGYLTRLSPRRRRRTTRPSVTIVPNKESLDRLAAACQEIAAPEASRSVSAARAAAVRLAPALFEASSGAAVEIDRQGRLLPLAHHGASLEPGARGSLLRSRAVESACEAVLADGKPRILPVSEGRVADIDPDDASGWLLLAPLGEEAVLAVAGDGPASVIAKGDLDRLAVFAQAAGIVIGQAATREALEHELECRRTMLEVSRGGVLVVSKDGHIRALNDNAAQLLGVPRGAAAGRPLREIAGLAELARLLSRSHSLDGEIIGLPGARGVVSARRYSDGQVVTLERVSPVSRQAGKRPAGRTRFSFEDLVGEAPSLLSAVRDAHQAAGTDAPILVTGESGCGKEVLAQAIHQASPRSDGPFVAINVAAIPRELLESELFGYERGAFTGARAGGLPGKFELAQDGTILLDEIGDMPMEMQAKMLRVLQERSVLRLGGTREIPVNARVIATTHRNLEEAVKEGRFRLDLFYRLRVVHLRLPPLRERPGDVDLLLDHYVDLFARQTGRAPVQVAEHIRAVLREYPWPGNVRELANLVEGWNSLLPDAGREVDQAPVYIRRALSQPDARGERPEASDEPGAVPRAPAGPWLGDEVRTLKEREKEIFEHALRLCEGNVAQAAKALGVARGTFYNKMARYGIAER